MGKVTFRERLNYCECVVRIFTWAAWAIFITDEWFLAVSIWGPIDSVDNVTDASTIYKLNEGVDFSTDFHVFSTEWSSEGFKFFVDSKLVGQLQAPEGGLWKNAVGDATKQNNPWISGSRMAPFDQPVSACEN